MAGPMAPLLSIFSADDPGGSERDDAVQLSTTLPNWVPFEVIWVMVCAGRSQIRPPHTGYFCREDENGLERTTGKMCESSSWDFSDLKAIFLNCTLKRSGEKTSVAKQVIERPYSASGGPENDFTNRNTTFMTWKIMFMARMLKDAGGIPAHGNQRSEWDAGCRFDFDNPAYC